MDNQDLSRGPVVNTVRVGQHRQFVWPEGSDVIDMAHVLRLSDGQTVAIGPEGWFRVDEIVERTRVHISINPHVMIADGAGGYAAVEPVGDWTTIDWILQNTEMIQDAPHLEEPKRAALAAERAKPIRFGGVEEAIAASMRMLAQTHGSQRMRRIEVGDMVYDYAVPAWATEEDLTLSDELLRQTLTGEADPTKLAEMFSAHDESAAHTAYTCEVHGRLTEDQVTQESEVSLASDGSENYMTWYTCDQCGRLVQKDEN
jgi:hypothetical protein